MKKPRSKLRWIRRLFTAGVLGLLLLLPVGWGLLQTTWLQEKLLTFAEGLTLPGELRLELEGPEGSWPFRPRLSEVRVFDSEGMWIDARDLELHWAYTQKVVRIRKAQVGEVQMYRRPVWVAAEPKNEPSGPLPEFQIRVKSAVIEMLVLDEQVIGNPFRGRIAFEGELSPSETTAAIEIESSIAKVTLVGEGNLFALEGQVTGKGQLLNQVEADVVATRKDGAITVVGQVSTADFLNLWQELDDQWIPVLPVLPVPGDPVIPVGLEMNWRWSQAQLLGELEGDTPAGPLTATVDIGTRTGTIQVVTKTERLDLAEVGRWFHQPLVGTSSGDLQYQRKEKQNLLKVNLVMSEAGWRDVKATRAILESQLMPEITADLKLEGVQVQEKTHIQSTELHLQRTDQAWKYTLQAEAPEGVWQDLDVTGSGTWSDGEGGLSITTGTVDLFDHPLALEEPMRLEVKDGGWELSPTQWKWREIGLQLQAGIAGEQVDVRLALDALKLSLLDPLTPIDLDGTMGGDVTLQGTLASPVLKVRLEGNQLRVDPKHQGPEMSLQLQVDGTWDAEKLILSTELSRNLGDRFTASLHADAPWRLSPFQMPDPGSNFKAEADGTLSLSVFNVLPALMEMRVEGLLETGFDVTRKDGELNVEGTLGVREGRFEHYGLGTLFRNGEVDGVWRENRFVLDHAEAETPGGGSIKLSGNVAPLSEGWEGELEATLDQARVLHLDAIQASLSGTVGVKKQVNEPAQLMGNLNLEDTTFHLDRLPPSSAEALEFRVVGAPEVEVEAEEESETPQRKARGWLEGSLQVNIPGTLRVEGGNVQTRWEGTLRTLFAEDGLRLTGSLKPRRGTVTFFSRAFTLDRSGEILFSDRIDTPPILDLTARHTRPELEASLRITGRADNPDFQLQSNPPYPENEIISRILFGKDMSTITGLQALEVGLALNSMRDNNRGSMDVMGQVRDTLRVDQLEIRETGDSSGNPELMAGRQINDRVYLEVQQNLREPGTTMLLEVEVGKSVSIFSESGTHIRPGIGVSWRKDY